MFKKRPRTQVSQGESTSRWDWKYWLGVIGLPITLVIVAAVLGWLTPEGRKWLGLDKPTSTVATSVPSLQSAIISASSTEAPPSVFVKAVCRKPARTV
jgi:hypothetical protein